MLHSAGSFEDAAASPGTVLHPRRAAILNVVIHHAETMIRVVVGASVVLASLTSGGGLASQTPQPLGVPVAEAREREVGGTPGAAPGEDPVGQRQAGGADTGAAAEAPEPVSRPGFGISGALRVLVSPPAAVIPEHHLMRVGGEWVAGHRWVPVHLRGAPTILGEPAPGPEGLRFGMITAPEEPGVWRLEGADGAGLTVVTQIPASQQRGAHLNGYHIGYYPTAGSDRRDAYAPPSGFIEVTLENRDLQLSDHLTLGQFLTKDQFDVWPKYVALDLRLIDKLELVMQELRLMGVHAEAMHIMSGFRTPQYNGPGGGGRAALSRHMWGDAADVWIDSLGDGRMDDLNGDGRVDLDDAAVMMRAVERVERKYPEMIGGAGTYPSSDIRGPYIHVDVRGQLSRW